MGVAAAIAQESRSDISALQTGLTTGLAGVTAFAALMSFPFHRSLHGLPGYWAKAASNLCLSQSRDRLCLSGVV